ncbi:MAG: heparan-alpha-glucosaminide N-acetyltransferase domain-containing protein, partial [Emcibacteraceae bacterium]|nr:heparan-alpha-glucosaminide N-acetyltransferase domain-containing protein [Emcibacteraceae bacterium]
MTDVAQKNITSKRIMSIDALRGLVMLFMLVDHVRETIYLHMQVGDPVDAAIVDPVLFYTRLLSAICAPAFVFLTGLSAWLYGQSHTKNETSMFLLKRGLFLMVLELIVISFAWTAQFPPEKFFLQVIWAIGVSMVVLAGLIHLPRIAQAVIAIGIVAGHNLLDGIVLNPTDSFYIPWSMLHQNVVFGVGWEMTAKTSYPVLAWFGVIGLGYLFGPWFGKLAGAEDRQKKLIK